MYQRITVYRVVCFGKPMGPWRLRQSQARREAVAAGLGAYSEWGSYFDVVPGEIQTKDIRPEDIGLTQEQVLELITSERRARLSARSPHKTHRQERSRDARGSKSMVRGARDRF